MGMEFDSSRRAHLLNSGQQWMARMGTDQME